MARHARASASEACAFPPRAPSIGAREPRTSRRERASDALEHDGEARRPNTSANRRKYGGAMTMRLTEKGGVA